MTITKSFQRRMAALGCSPVEFFLAASEFVVELIGFGLLWFSTNEWTSMRAMCVYNYGFLGYPIWLGLAYVLSFEWCSMRYVEFQYLFKGDMRMKEVHDLIYSDPNFGALMGLMLCGFFALYASGCEDIGVWDDDDDDWNGKDDLYWVGTVCGGYDDEDDDYCFEDDYFMTTGLGWRPNHTETPQEVCCTCGGGDTSFYYYLNWVVGFFCVINMVTSATELSPALVLSSWAVFSFTFNTAANKIYLGEAFVNVCLYLGGALSLFTVILGIVDSRVPLSENRFAICGAIQL